MNITCGVIRSSTEEEPVTDHGGIVFRSIMNAYVLPKGSRHPTGRGMRSNSVGIACAYRKAGGGFRSHVVGHDSTSLLMAEPSRPEVAGSGHIKTQRQVGNCLNSF